jgi:hypothetical protein
MRTLNHHSQRLRTLDSLPGRRKAFWKRKSHLYGPRNEGLRGHLVLDRRGQHVDRRDTGGLLVQGRAAHLLVDLLLPVATAIFVKWKFL